LALAYRRDQINWTTRIVAVAVFTFSAAAAAQNLVWAPVGPSPTTAGQVEGIADGPVAGAIKAVTPHPNDANVVYIGAVNGGVWKTTDAWSKRPHWQPLTDDQKSLSIGALAFDPKAMAAPCASISNPAPSHRKGPIAPLSPRR
jgi:hypothetical protein